MISLTLMKAKLYNWLFWLMWTAAKLISTLLAALALGVVIAIVVSAFGGIDGKMYAVGHFYVFAAGCAILALEGFRYARQIKRYYNDKVVPSIRLFPQ